MANISLHLSIPESVYSGFIEKAHSNGCKGTEYAKNLILKDLGIEIPGNEKREIINKKCKNKYF